MSDQPLVKRIAHQKNNIKMMLSPGGKTSSLMTPSLSMLKVFTDFGGKKYLSAYQKMRTLDPVGLGSLSPNKFLQPLIHSFHSAADLLHIKPQNTGANSWSKVDTVFPSAAESQPEPAARPGELRAGSIIPRMTSMPKAAQPQENSPTAPALVPASRPPDTSGSVKPRIAAPTRRFSRIQEIQPGRKETDAAADDLPDLPAPSLPAAHLAENVPAMPNTGLAPLPGMLHTNPPAPGTEDNSHPSSADQQTKPGVEKRASDHTVSPSGRPSQAADVHDKTHNTIQRQPETSSSSSHTAVSTPAATSQPAAQHAQQPGKQASSQPQQPTTFTVTPASPAEKPAEPRLPAESENTSLAEPVTPPARPAAQTNLPPERFPEKINSTPAVLKPVSTLPAATNEPQGMSGEQTLPLAAQPLPTSAPANVPNTTPPTLARRAEQRPERPLAQPSPARPNMAVEPQTTSEPFPALTPAKPAVPAQMEPPRMRLAVAKIAAQPTAQPGSPPSAAPQEMDPAPGPAQAQNSIARQPLLTPRALDVPALASQRSSAPQAISLLAKPLVRAQKYSPQQVSPAPGSANAGQPFSRGAEIPTPSQAGEESATAPLDLSLARPTSPPPHRPAAAAPVTLAPTARIPTENVKQPEPTQQPAENTAEPDLAEASALAEPMPMSPVRNTIQRNSNKWPEHEGLTGGTVGAGSQQAEDETQQAEIDLAQLADDVFPYIKRLIEQESDRISSRFRF